MNHGRKPPTGPRGQRQRAGIRGQVPPQADGDVKRAASARQAYFLRLAEKSAQARARRKGGVA